LEYITIAQAAREKGVSRAAVYYAIRLKFVDFEKIAGTDHIIRNEKFAAWTPKTRLADTQ